jgi:hypothetical protein
MPNMKSTNVFALWFWRWESLQIINHILAIQIGNLERLVSIDFHVRELANLLDCLVLELVKSLSG